MIESEYDFEKGDELSDTQLIVQEKIINVHKAILGKSTYNIYLEQILIGEERAIIRLF